MRLLAVALAAAACSACSAGDASSPEPGIDVARAMSDMRTLAAMGPRVYNHSEQVQHWIEQQLADMHADVERLPVGVVELPRIEVLGATYRHAHPIDVSDPNYVIHVGPDSSNALLVMAHYDSVPTSPGAADNAAGVAVALELARALNDKPPAQPVIVALTAAEEPGLVGAEALMEHFGHDIGFAIALDLVGGDGDLVINGASTLIGNAELSWIADAADRAGVVVRAPLAHRVVSRWWPQAERSDHGPFTRHGIRAIHFYDRGNDGEWIDLAYHSPRDTADRVHAGKLAELGRLLRALAASPIPVHRGDGFWLPVVHNTVVSRTALVAVEILLLVLVVAALMFSREGLVSMFTQRRGTPRGLGLLAGTLCYVLAMGAAVLVERVFAGGHPAPWLHAPLRAEIGTLSLLIGLVGLGARALARVWSWRGEYRYLALAMIVLAALGALLLAAGAAELAWIWLVPAAALAIAPRLGRFAPLAIVLALLPPALALHPLQLREGAWNGFLPAGMPLAIWIGVLALPFVAGIAWLSRRRRTPGPVGALALGVGCGLLVIIGLVVAITASPACTAVKFKEFHLACERV